MKIVIASFFFLILSACQMTPTKVSETTSVNYDPILIDSGKPILLNDSTVIVDAREDFDFHTSHLPGSVHLRWEDFSGRGQNEGYILDDKFMLARRLAAYGISPKSEVVVVGGSENDRIRMGRVAFILAHLGVKDIRLIDISQLKGPQRFSNTTPQKRKSVTIWEPALINRIQAQPDEVIEFVAGKGRTKTHMIDVRTTKEYFNKSSFGGSYKNPNLNTINIPWDQFFDQKGRPNRDILSQLQGIDIQPEDRVLVISDKGVRSSAVTVVLLSLGYQKAASVDGGYEALQRRANARPSFR